jgi:hypothetical protein
MRESLASGANVTSERQRHPKKHWSPTSSTDEGMAIDERDEHAKKAALSIRNSLEPDPNVTVTRE